MAQALKNNYGTAAARSIGVDFFGEIAANENEPNGFANAIDLKERNLVAVIIEPHGFEAIGAITQANKGVPTHASISIGEDIRVWIFRRPKGSTEEENRFLRDGIRVLFDGVVPGIDGNGLSGIAELPIWLLEPAEPSPVVATADKSQPVAGADGYEPQQNDSFATEVTQESTDNDAKPPSFDRPAILVIGGELPREVDDAEAALIAAGLGLYQRGSSLVRPADVPVTIAGGKQTMARRLIEVTAYYLVEAMTRSADFQRFDARSGGLKSVDCPRAIADTYRARVGQWGLPVLTGAINAPTLRSDGSILHSPGYDASTGLLYDPDDIAYPTVPINPSQDDARAALAIFLALLGEFPFVSGADQSVALSGILTTLLRRSLPTAPLHGFDAPAPGSGKSMLVSICSMIASGHPAPVIAQGKTEEEMEKRLGAALIAGDALISIDNCESPLGGELLCQALTQPMLKVRFLGQSVNADVPTNAAMFATGNNLTLVGDITRRAIRCSLDPGVERPELREFKTVPLALIQMDRAKYVIAGLTILRAYHVAGRPEQRPPLGGFEDWSRWVRDSLIWLGEADPCGTIENIRASDPKREEMTMVFEGWSRLFQDRSVTARDVIKAAIEQKGEFREFIHADFRESLLAVAGTGGIVSTRRLGKWLGANKNRVVGGNRLVQAGLINGIQNWRLERVNEGGASD